MDPVVVFRGGGGQTGQLADTYGMKGRGHDTPPKKKNSGKLNNFDFLGRRYPDGSEKENARFVN